MLEEIHLTLVLNVKCLRSITIPKSCLANFTYVLPSHPRCEITTFSVSTVIDYQRKTPTDSGLAALVHHLLKIVQLFQHLGYHYLGNWSDRANNSNIETELISTFLRDKQGYSDSLITKAL